MQTETMRDSSFHQFAKEYHVPADFLDGNMEVLHTCIYLFKVIQFVIMGPFYVICEMARKFAEMIIFGLSELKIRVMVI
jgi:hypothetical protein